MRALPREIGPDIPTEARRDLQLVLDAWSADAAILERHGHERDANMIRRFCKDVAYASEDWLVFLSEGDACLRSGHSVGWLRSRFARWEQDGHARKRSGHRQYRMIIVPTRDNLTRILAARKAGRTAGGRLRDT